MTTTPGVTPPTGPPANTSLSTATRTTGGAMGKDAFLQLLVASMKYQDPSKPVDSQAYMAQLAQFTQVEKLDAISSAQSEASRWQRTVAGQAMIGHTVTGTGAAGATVSGVVTGVTITATGPRLQLTGGGSLAVDDVTNVGAVATGA